MKKVISVFLIISAMFICTNVYADSRVEINRDLPKLSDSVSSFSIILEDYDSTLIDGTGDDAETNCSTLGLLKKDIHGAFSIFKIVAPILVVAVSIYDFIKAFTGKVEGETAKAFSRLVKRLMFAMILFFLPTILDFVLGLIDSGYSTCVVD